MAKDVQSLFNPSRDFMRSTARNWREKDDSRLIFHGIVTFVDRIGLDSRPRFSLQAKIIGIDDPDAVEATLNFYQPLMPIGLISVPEVGEEVLIFCETPRNFRKAYWISRSNDINLLTKVLAGDVFDNIREFDKHRQTNVDRHGTPQKPTETQDTEPNRKYDIPVPRVKPGDVIMQGRSNTFTRHTFDSKNRQGVIEHVTEEKEVEGGFYDKDFRKSNGVRIIQATNSDLDTQIAEQYELEFHENYSDGTTGDGINSGPRGKKKTDTAYLFLEALELRILSRRGKKINHLVLAEEQELWLIALINLIKTLIDDLEDFRKNIFDKHKHMANGPTSPPLAPELMLSKNDFKNRLATDKENFENHKQPIPNHHSKTTSTN